LTTQSKLQPALLRLPGDSRMRERYGSAKLKELCCLKDWPSDELNLQ